MNKFTRVLMTLAAPIIIVASVAPAASATDDKSGASTSQVSNKATNKGAKQKCTKTAKSTSATSGVLTSTVCISLNLLKENKCVARAFKREQPAPPADPKSVCKGKMKVTIKASIETTPCPPGWYGGQARLQIQFRQVTKVYAMAQSIASGNSSTFAETYISIKDKVKGWTKSDCVQVPPPPVVYSTPTVSASPKACVKPGEQTGTVTVTGVNPNSVGATGTFTVSNKPAQTIAVGAGQSVSLDFSGFAPGLYSGSFSLGAPINLTAGFTVVVQECVVTPPVNPAPKASGPTVNDVLVNNERDMTFTGKLAKGTTGVATAAAGTGTIVGTNRVNLVVDADGYFTLTVRYRAGDEPGRDTVTLFVEQSDGQTVTTTTMGRDAAGNVVPHFEVRKAPVDPERTNNK